MAKTRVHELAKSLEISSSDLIEMLKSLGVEATSHSATLEDEIVDKVRIRLAGTRRREKKATAKRPVRRRPPGEGETDSEGRPVRRVRKRPVGDGEAEAEKRRVARPGGAKRAPVKKPLPEEPKKEPAKESAAKKAPAKKAPAKKAPPKEAEAKESGAKLAPPKDAPAKTSGETPSKAEPAKEAAAKEPAAKKAPAKKAPAKETAPEVDEASKAEATGPPAASSPSSAPPAQARDEGKKARSADKGAGSRAKRPAGPSGGELAREGGNATAPAPPAPKRTSGPKQGAPVQPPAPEPALAQAEERPAQTKGEAPAAPPMRERQPRQPEAPAGPLVTSVAVRRGVTVQEFAALVGLSATEIVRRLMALGEMKTVTMSLTDEEVELLGADLGVETKVVSADAAREEEEASRAEEEAIEDEGRLVSRAPVVTVMGHVDHGKTLLLDRIREADVISGEAGGITQHIGAYRVHHHDKWITFIDTPGHEAFTMMRARGASITDIAVLVVAADDGVMPQTVEAISHIRAANVPMVVAINKIDRADADPQRVRAQLTEHEVLVEDFGGEVPVVEISALERVGIEELLEMIQLVAELCDLKSNPDVPASGVCLEAHLDQGRGSVATVLVRRGTLKKSDAFYAGNTYGRVRAMLDEHGAQLDSAGPSVPVQVLGFISVPEAGDDFRVMTEERGARSVAEGRQAAERRADQVSVPPVARLEDLFAQIQSEHHGTLNLILKADVQGSLEALAGSVRKLERPEVQLNLVHSAIGGITENDVMLAQASGALVVGFNVRPDRKSRELALRSGVEIRTYEVIYQAIEEIEAAMKGLLIPEYEEVITGTAEVRATFKVPRIGTVAGCYIQEGTITRSSKARLLRDGAVIYSGTVSSLRRFKDDVREVQSGYECGIGLEDYNDIKEGDVIETFEERELPRS